MSKAAYHDFVIEIIPDLAEQQGFHVPGLATRFAQNCTLSRKT
jgi:hypothetical protein